jgi:hypothetical protein
VYQVYRTYILYNGEWLFIALPILLWLALFGTVFIILYKIPHIMTGTMLGSSFPLALLCAGQGAGGPLHLPSPLAIATAFYSLTAALQLLTMGLIVFKLIIHRLELRKQGLDASHGVPYVSLAGMLAESSGIYAFASIAYIPMIRSNNPVQLWWGQVVASLVVRYARITYVYAP